MIFGELQKVVVFLTKITEHPIANLLLYQRPPQSYLVSLMTSEATFFKIGHFVFISYLKNARAT